MPAWPVLFYILSRILFLRQLNGEDVEIMLCRVDVREAFRQVLVDPSKASVFGYVMGDVVVVDLRCQFGWRSSPGFWSLFSSALEHSHTHTTFQTASVLPVGAESVDHVHIVSPTAPAARLPRDCATIVKDSGLAGSAFFVRYYVDDGVLVEAKFFQDGRRCRRAVQSLASDHFRLLGTRGPNDPPLLSKEKNTDFNTRLEVLGWILDTQQLTVTMPAQKQQKLARVLGNWPATRTSATARQVSELTGFLMHVCFALRPGNFSWGGHWPQLGCHNLPCFRLVCPNPTAAWCWGLCFTRTWIFGDGSKRGVLLRVAGLCVRRCTILCNGP